MQTYQKNKSTFYDIRQLQEEINSSQAIIPSCLSITGDGEDLTLEFASSLTPSEESTLDGLILSHTPSQDTVDVTDLPFSDLDNKRLLVHPSYKPKIDGGSTYAVWAGAGDDLAEPTQVGTGDLLHFSMTPGNQVTSIAVYFNPAHGRVWIHEGYLRYEDAGPGDYVTADVVSMATPVQDAQNLDLVIEDDWIKYSPSGPGTGTHGFGGSPVLVPRSFSKDGDWDYDGTNLTPNFTSTGGFKISSIERNVHRYINKIPCCGSCPTYFSMSSDETTELPAGYFLRINVHNVSNGTWHADVIMEMYRERTHIP